MQTFGNEKTSYPVDFFYAMFSRATPFEVKRAIHKGAWMCLKAGSFAVMRQLFRRRKR